MSEPIITFNKVNKWYGNNFHVLRDDPASWQHSFGEALDAYPYVVPDVRQLAWPKLLGKLAIWKHLHIVPEAPKPSWPIHATGVLGGSR